MLYGMCLFCACVLVCAFVCFIPIYIYECVGLFAVCCVVSYGVWCCALFVFVCVLVCVMWLCDVGWFAFFVRFVVIVCLCVHVC